MAAEPRQRRRVLLGALLTAGLFAVAVLIFFMDDLLTSLRSEYHVVAVLPGAAGLAEGTPVWISGREVGAVAAVGFMPSGGDTLARIVLQLRLPTSVQPQVRRDSEVRITSVGLVSERVIDISPGTAAALVLAPGDTLRQAARLSPVQLTQRAELVRADLDVALAGLRTHVPEIRARMAQTRHAFAGMDAVMDEARRLQGDMNANPGLALLHDPAFAASLANVRGHVQELPILIGRLRATTGAAADVRAALARLHSRADTLGSRLAAATAALENPNGTLARLQQDTALTRALNAARAELDSLMADVRSNPLRYVF